ncbi:hypothetical protein BMT55_11015 [Listeria newyorkensis]|uniref:Uncharacterized protein n=4 Tax=Listeria newyorkensis TaxID=1497681 RepID=A0ABX4XKV0_9LIST|nr:immunoglobulin-like domain-containing protein [Listeria newyorkensis]PNP90920.1 hypothetical protein BMT55_11015 [Listeria newyorkensis]WAO20387.2 toxin Cry1Ac domain D-VI-related protein [Listeria newyorkensis]
MKKHMKKIASVLTVASILGTSVITPFNALSEIPVKAAVSATAPIYTAPTEFPAYKEFSKTNVSVYLPLIEFYGVYLEIDMTKLSNGYGLQVKLPDGTTKTQYSTTAAGVSEKMYIDVLSQEYTKNTRISINVISPAAKIVEQNDVALTGADFIGDAEKGLQDFGQKVYNLYQNQMFVTLATGITAADVDAAENAALTVEESSEKFRLMNLLNEAHQQFDTLTYIKIKQQNEVARKAVNELFTNNTPTSGTIKSTLTQSAFDAAKTLVNQLIDSTQKTAMLADLQQAQNLLKASSVSLTVAPFQLGKDNYVTGQFSGDVAKISLTVNGGTEGVKVGVTPSVLKYYAKNVILKDTDDVLLTAYDTKGTVLGTKKVTVEKQVVTTGSIDSITPFKIGTDNYVTGKYSGDVAKISLTVNGVEGTKVGVTPPDLKYYAKGVILKDTDIVKLTAYDVTGKVLDTETVTIAKQVVTSGFITSIAPFKIGTDNYITGQYTGDVAKISLTVNGVEGVKVPVTPSAIKYYAKTVILNTTDKAVLTTYDINGKVLDTETVSTTK